MNAQKPQNNRVCLALIVVALLAAPPLLAQDSAKSTGAEELFQQTSTKAEQDLQKALKELSELREAIAAEKLPLTRKLTKLESELLDAREEFEDQSRILDTRNLDLNNLRTESQGRVDEKTYLSTLLDEYIRNFETRVHISELQRYADVVEEARLAPENEDLTATEVFLAQTNMVDVSLDRLIELTGGSRFEGSAVGPDGLVKHVEFALIGPIAIYGAEDASDAGLAEQRLGSLEPNLVPFETPEQIASAQGVIRAGQGEVPFDPTLGNARKIEATQESLVDHIKKGGPVMVPILLLATTALIVALLKWAQLSRVRRPPTRRVNAVLDSVRTRDYPKATEQAQKISGPTGEMLRVGLEHIEEPKEMVEEVMFEKTLETRLRLQSFLSFVAVSAAAAPLLGLLGTVTGIINTFKLITVFGTGDAKTLSSGISEALITTEFGLIVAIPSLLLHAYLSRKARRVVDGMEKVAVSFLNRIRSTTVPGQPSTQEIAEQVLAMLQRQAGGQSSTQKREGSAEEAAGAWPLVGQPEHQPEH
jgi:biopolymer transport protein ExbB